jgi:hypothetical protein
MLDRGRRIVPSKYAVLTQKEAVIQEKKGMKRTAEAIAIPFFTTALIYLFKPKKKR